HPIVTFPLRPDFGGVTDETIPASVHEVGESSTVTFHKEDGDSLLPVRSSVEEGAAAMENLVRKLVMLKKELSVRS
ncbi:hypothetical protein Tco_0310869, partial [Tanacetum coccineum]